MKQDKGYSLIELIIIVTVFITLAALTINYGPMVTTIDIEAATGQVVTNLTQARRNAQAGTADKLKRTFDINKSVSANHPGITVTDQLSIYSQNKCQNPCRGQQQICISGQSFCYSSTTTMEFERYSGNLPQTHAIFLISKARQMGVLVETNGHLTVVEMINGQWRSRDDLQIHY